MEQQLHELTGTIDRLLFNNEESGFSVFVLQVNAATQIVVRGSLAQIHSGEQVSVRGSWVMHPKFGKQFEAKECKVTVPTSIMGLKKYLGSGLIKGIGPAYAEKLVDAFGSRVLEVIDKEPERLRGVNGIGEKRVKQIIASWHDQKEISSIMVFLQDKGVSPAYAIKIYKKYGQQSIAVVQENPYRLAEEIWGIGFKVADQIAQNVGIPRDSLKRVKAGILYQISQEVGFGHLYVEIPQLKEKTALLLELDDEQKDGKIKHALHDLYNEDKIKLVSHQEKHFITLSAYYTAEKGVCERIKLLIDAKSSLSIDAQSVYQKLRAVNESKQVQLNDDQVHGIITSLAHKMSVITGGPGTGKTTLIKQLLSVLDEYQISYRLAAPTGRAAKRITEGTGRQAATIHRLLEFDFVTRGFVRNEQNALKLDFLIIDEASMIDIFLAHSLLKAVPFHAHVLFIGDVDQLPSVGAGNFLNDLIASQKVACVRLTKIFRQAQDSLIIINAHRVNSGEFPTTTMPDVKKDFLYIKEDNPEAVNAHMKELFTRRLSMMGIKAEDATVLVPMNRGIVGTYALNHTLQQLLNPVVTEKQLTHHGTVFKVGDRVMQIRNNYDKIVFNGDCGDIEDINVSDRIIYVRYSEKVVEYDAADLDELVLAYALSIHKSQGSEYPAVIIPIFMQHFTLLQRNLLYTAITRAKKVCILIGQSRAIAMAIKNNKGLERITFLKEFLTTNLSCR